MEFQNFTDLAKCNFHLDSGDTSELSNSIDCCISFGLSQLVDEPTHRPLHTLDGIFSNNPSINFERTLPMLWTDHKAVFFKVDIPWQILHSNRPSFTKVTCPWHWICKDDLVLSNGGPLYDPTTGITTNNFTLWLD